MCGRARLSTDYSDIRIELDFDAEAPSPNLQPRYNLAPTDDVLVGVRDPASGRRRPMLMRWGLIPGWAKDDKLSYSTFNARADGLTQKASFRGAWKAGRRCLVVTDGFYEWRQSDQQPFAVAMANGRRMVFAGLWEEWKSPQGERIRSATIITTEANAVLAPLHPRMPVILSPDDFSLWLGERAGDEEALKMLLKPCPVEWLTLWPVDRRIGSVHHDDPALITPVAETPPPQKAVRRVKTPPSQGSLF